MENVLYKIGYVFKALKSKFVTFNYRKVEDGNPIGFTLEELRQKHEGLKCLPQKNGDVEFANW
mgnify:CR=1 FL=1